MTGLEAVEVNIAVTDLHWPEDTEEGAAESRRSCGLRLTVLPVVGRG
ncbi:Asp23/Gls24 family envelope stress response protein [Amycolatopsis albidoflavus]|uniref:Uncharacterized protein n=1 Tax=Amycolatopsis albidoflavus TaxID=102226 RepID=A0ABW5HZ06_9PSEU